MPKFSFNKLNRYWSRIPVSYRGGLILTIPAICTIAILTVWIELRNDAIAVHREIDQTESITIEANNLLFLLTSAKTGVRGYAIAKQTNFLQPYQQAIADLPNNLNKLEDLQSDVSQQQDIEEIAQLAQRELDLLAQTIDRIENGTTAEVNMLLMQGEKTNAEVTQAIDIFKTKHWQMMTVAAIA